MFANRPLKSESSPGKTLRRPTAWLAALTLTFAAIALGFRTQPISTLPHLVLAVGSTFVPLVALVGLLLALWSRRIVLSIVAVSLLLITAGVQVRWYYVGKPVRMGEFGEIRVLSSNLRYGLADAAEFVSLAEHNADLISVAELTREAVKRYIDQGIGRSFPYSQLTPAAGPGGIGIWSRYPLEPVTAPRHRNVSMPAARLEVPGLDLKPLVASVHVMSPVAGDENTVDDWRYGMAGAKAQLDNFGATAGSAAVIVGGDYNSTPDMRQFRDLLTDGYNDAVAQLGAGFAPTFKADGWLPPVITIDHIITRNATASSVRTVKVKGSDHRALLATVRVPVHPEW